MVDKTKFLGVVIDKKLTFESHVQYIKGKINRGMGIIYKAGKYLNRDSLITLYYSFLYPYLNFCVTVWGNSNRKYLHGIIITQKRAVRNICKKERRSESAPLLK